MQKYYARKADGSILELNENATDSFIESKKRNSGCSHEYSSELISTSPYFEPVTELDFPRMKLRGEQYYSYLSWATRSNGHGGSKGGTIEEWLKLNGQTRI